MYKAPPPEVSSEQFYETDEARGFARGFSIQTVSPLPIGWAEHVLADGHWGAALREYMRDYNHWTVLGVALRAAAAAGEPRHARRRDRPVRHAGRALRLLPVRQRPRQHRVREEDDARDLGDARARRTCSRSTATRTSSAAAGWAPTPTTSVVDSDHRAWGVPNLFVCDGSVMPTQGARTRRSRSWRSPLASASSGAKRVNRWAERPRQGRGQPGSLRRCSGRAPQREASTHAQEPRSGSRRRHRSLRRRRTRDRARVRQARSACRAARARRARSRGSAATRSRSSAARRSCCRSTWPTTTQVEAAAEAVEERFGPIDVWVNNAMATVFAPFVEVEPRGVQARDRGDLSRRGLRHDGGAEADASARPRHDRPGRLGARLPRDPAAVRLLRRQVRDPRLHRLGAHRAHARPQQGLDHDGAAAGGQHAPVQLVPDEAARPPPAGAADLPARGARPRPSTGPHTTAGASSTSAAARSRRSSATSSRPASPTGTSPAPATRRNRSRTCRSNGRPDNLFEPVPGEAATHGMFDSQAHERSYQLWANTHRPLLAGALAGATQQRRPVRLVR